MRAFGPVAAPIDTNALSDIPPDWLHPDPSTRPHLMQLGTLRLPFEVRQHILQCVWIVPLNGLCNATWQLRAVINLLRDEECAVYDDSQQVK